MLKRLFIKDYKNTSDPAVRIRYGVVAGAFGIATNILLFVIKIIIGLLANSITIVAEAVNNLSDAGSSAVTLLGFRLAGKKPDPHHPFGHGRLEYVSGLIVAGLILLMGVELAKTSVEKILHPSAVDFSVAALVILAASICVKLYMCLYNRRVGKRIHSAAMEATAADSLSDTAATAAVLLAMCIARWTSLDIDGWVGLVVAGFILFSGVKSARETISPLLGQPPEKEFVDRIESIVLSHPAILGLHDLVVHDYGPGRVMVSLHAEVPAHGDLLELHDIVDNIEMDLSRQLNCQAVIHMDPVVTDDGLTAETREKVAALARIIDPGISIHDFRMVNGVTHTNLIFDVVVPYDVKLSDEEVINRLKEKLRQQDETYTAVIQVDHSYVL
mgnify:CR=1 FL=1